MKKMKSVPVNEEIYNYILDRFVPEDKIADEIISRTEKLDIPLIQISPDQGRFLYLLTKIINAEYALEIGTLAGFSGYHIASGLADGGKLTTIEISKKHGDLAAEYFKKAGLENKTEVIISPALDQLEKLVNENRKYDLIFIDADKINYIEYFEYAVKLSHSGTVIIFDNMIKDGRVTGDAGDDEDLRAIQMTNDLLSKDERVESFLLVIGDGFTISRVR
ncbi:MAG: O-methyltransferase [Bacteroidetes bacterium]|nr:O-methyltransferase [Bacteroidota bacterium]